MIETKHLSTKRFFFAIKSLIRKKQSWMLPCSRIFIFIRPTSWLCCYRAATWRRSIKSLQRSSRFVR